MLVPRLWFKNTIFHWNEPGLLEKCGWFKLWVGHSRTSCHKKRKRRETVKDNLGLCKKGPLVGLPLAKDSLSFKKNNYCSGLKHIKLKSTKCWLPLEDAWNQFIQKLVNNQIFCLTHINCTSESQNSWSKFIIKEFQVINGKRTTIRMSSFCKPWWNSMSWQYSSETTKIIWWQFDIKLYGEWFRLMVCEPTDQC